MKMKRQAMQKCEKYATIRLGKSHGTLKMSRSMPPLESSSR